ncbi:MAG: HAD-IA family hydrolase [Alphaproteobacteria bacterium]|nr:HAD-IA family hydrolase [Alphaproteobacteria bacterium]MDE2336786.1 HAD-IA family hydrolase [Alphaproteobacteria bacterium]
MTKLIVFDVDGTFLNSQVLYDRTVLEYSAAQGLPAPCLRTIHLGYGDPHAHDFGWGVSKDEQLRHMIETMVLADKYSMSGAPEHTPPFFDGAQHVFERLKNAGYTLAIVTSKPEAPLLHLLDYHNARNVFSAHRTFDDIERRNEREKPEPDMLRSVMRELDFSPEDTVMVGDTTMDIRMGRSANTHTIGVTWGAHTKEHLVEAGAHYIVETGLGDVAQVVEKIFTKA